VAPDDPGRARVRGRGFDARDPWSAFRFRTSRKRWPVLLFSHGRSFPVENYQIALEQLASQGWVIAAISHPYEEAATLLPDGTTLPFRGPTWDDESERGAVLTGVVDELVRDASLVIDLSSS
jgi:predicted dienelactone hydrolase